MQTFEQPPPCNAHRTLWGVVAMTLATTACIESGSRPVAETETLAAVCTEGERRCIMDASTLVVCTGGQWDETVCSDLPNSLCLDDDRSEATCIRLTGNDSCREVMTCVTTCQVDGCETDCILAGAVEEGRAAVEVLECIDEADCLNTPNGVSEEIISCVGDACGDSLAACYYPTTGAKSCSEVIQCATECDGRDACSIACAHEANVAAQAKYATIEFCLLVACTVDPGEGCVRAAFEGLCAEALSDCTRDS